MTLDVRTDGFSGAAGFLRCAETYAADSTIVANVSAVAPALSRNDLKPAP